MIITEILLQMVNKIQNGLLNNINTANLWTVMKL